MQLITKNSFNMGSYGRRYYFEYTLNGLLKWYNSQVGSTSDNDLSTLKVMKLLFFVSAAKATPENNSTLLDTTFVNFVAMPYGHVESDVYNYLKSNSGFEYFKVDTKSTQSISNKDWKGGDAITNLIDESIEELKQHNPDLITYSPFELVELSHMWYSWQKCFGDAKRSGFSSMAIPADIIKNEPKLFRLKVLS